jgi:hypothetical protein
MHPLNETDLDKVFDNLCYLAAMRVVLINEKVVCYETIYDQAKELLTKWWSEDLKKNLLGSKGQGVYNELANSLAWQITEVLTQK